ncbi:MAG: ABC transporter permease [Lachnospiraceae bacterium]|nr:ABC transporter permease [Lachnospiraceae bacterium]
MRISTIFYIFKQGFKNIWHNLMFSIASIATMGACIFLFGLFFSILVNFQYIVRNAETNVTITVLFEEGLDQGRINEIGELINARDEVVKVEYKSAMMAWEEFRVDYFEGDEKAARGFGSDNPLAKSSSYEVYVETIEAQNGLVSYVEGLQGVRAVNRSEAAMKTLSTFNRLLGYVSAAIILILLAVSVFLISNTVSVGISVRREEIAIMKLIGATNFFVRAPFLVEGIMIGLVGSAAPLAVVYVLYGKVVSYVLTRFHILQNIVQFLDVDQVFGVLLPIGLILGMGIGFMGSVMTIRKHLKV